ncbi:hypothetical protein MB02_01750 [Croceicoccus estronivorus]|uniref:phasin family protein n=1 Tax=Croceicoccus estronivorus TaxID=1172626 RepID=UPI00082C8EEE|nr:phasin family protein [Croceicoccus estronivorus]OCC25403.1 hypothetical protein MB02_01750 [Croceicoccus estronivorus]
MPDNSESKAAAAAEKAYAEAAAGVKATEAAKPETAEPEAVSAPAPASPVADEKPAPVKATAPATKKPAAAKKAPTRKASPAKKPAPKAAPAKPAAKAPVKKPAPAARKAKPTAPKTAVKAAEPVLTIPQLKEKIMSTASKKKDFPKMFESAVTSVKAKAKEAYDKGTAVAGEMGTLSKGNIEAVVESSKIFASGMKDIGADCVTETKGAYETATGDFKKLASIKSPTELFQLQGELMRRNFDSAVAFGSKETEKLVKLTNDTFAPISTRVSLMVDKISKAA